ncbi:MAG: PD-(D/E)XK nuclease-like domain-containing protein [Nocardioides sp.]
MNQRELEKAIEREVGEWPDATVEFKTGGKHPKAKLTHGGKILNVVFPGTPGDSGRGVHNTLSEVRRALKKLGASRLKPEPTKDEDEAPYRKANDGAAQRPSPVVSVPAVARPTVAEQLGPIAGSAIAARDVGIDQAEAAPDPDDAAAQLRAAFMARVEGIVDGIYFGLPADVYHAVPRLSSSGLQKLCVSPGTFWRGSWLDPDRPDLDDEETIWQLLGRAYHTARLEPHLFEATYVRELDKKDAPKGTLFTATDMGKKLEDFGLKKAGSVLEQAERLADSGFPSSQLWPLIKAEWDEARGTRTPLPAKHFDQMLADRDRISLNSQIAPLLSGGEAEVSIFWTDQHGLKMKCRCDYLTRDWWSDFKTFDNSRGKHLKQALADAVRYNRYYIQAPVYREGIEAIRTGGLQIIEADTDDQRALIAAIQIKPDELACWYIFQEKGGIPNLLAYQFSFYSVPYTTVLNGAGATAERQAVAVAATSQRTDLFRKGEFEVLNAKKLFVLYSEVYQPGEPWFPIDAIGAFTDDDFHPYWLAGDIA